MDGSAVTVDGSARGGLEVRAEPGRLVVRGPRSLGAVAQRLLERKGEVLALLAAEDADVAWRLMRCDRRCRDEEQSRCWSRVSVPEPGCCISCGDQLHEGVTFRCVPCARAAWVVLHEIREDVCTWITRQERLRSRPFTPFRHRNRHRVYQK